MVPEINIPITVRAIAMCCVVLISAAPNKDTHNHAYRMNATNNKNVTIFNNVFMLLVKFT